MNNGLVPVEQLAAIHLWGGNTIAPQIRLIASDVDGTLTRQGKFSVEFLEALAQLQQAGIALLLVTGRSAGWVQGLGHYFPVAGAIAENGGVYIDAAGNLKLLSSIPDTTNHRQQLAATFESLKQSHPQLQAATDNPFRLTDWTFDMEGLTEQDLVAINLQCQHQGWSFTYSTVQGHIKPAQQGKAQGLQQVLQQHFPQVQPQQLLTVGDSPNDASLFDPALFPLSVGVANVLNYRDVLPHLPRYVTTQPEIAGFCELVRAIIAHRFSQENK